MNNKEMPLSRRAQDARVGYVAILVCNVLTHLTRGMLKENRVPTMIRTACNARDGARGKTRICAAYNSSPSQDASDPDSENMTMEPCANRATFEASHKSQIHIEHA